MHGKDFLVYAASLKNLKLSAFVLNSAIKEAEDLVDNKTQFALPEAQWKAFSAVTKSTTPDRIGKDLAVDKAELATARSLVASLQKLISRCIKRFQKGRWITGILR